MGTGEGLEALLSNNTGPYARYDLNAAIERTERYLEKLQGLVVEAVGTAGTNKNLDTKLQTDYDKLTSKTAEQIALVALHIEQLTGESSKQKAELASQKAELAEAVDKLDKFTKELNLQKQNDGRMRLSLINLKNKLLELKLDFGCAPVFV
jgi:chromosome segregation ATPase